MGWQMPEVGVGDLVLWHSDPSGVDTPVMGWIVERPGRETVSILVFSQAAGFIEKKSVRHKDDPFWRENENAGNWQQWGCWSLHHSTELLKELKVLLTKAKLNAAKGDMSEVKRGPGRPRKEETSEMEVADA